MRAAVFTETGGPLTIENLEPNPPGPRDVVVQVGASGVPLRTASGRAN